MKRLHTVCLIVILLLAVLLDQGKRLASVLWRVLAVMALVLASIGLGTLTAGASPLYQDTTVSVDTFVSATLSSGTTWAVYDITGKAAGTDSDVYDAWRPPSDVTAWVEYTLTDSVIIHSGSRMNGYWGYVGGIGWITIELWDVSAGAWCQAMYAQGEFNANWQATINSGCQGKTVNRVRINSNWTREFRVASFLVTGTPGATATPTSTATATPTATPEPGSSNNSVLKDGNMEQRPTSQYWALTVPGTKFGRLQDGNIWTGGDACDERGSGYHAIGQVMGWPWESGTWGGIYQNFSWPASLPVYWSVTAWGNADNANYPARMVMYVVDSNGANHMLLDQQLTANWTVYTGTYASLAPGPYQIMIENSGSVYDTVFVDDVAILGYARPTTCSNSGQNVPNDGTVTPTPGGNAAIPGNIPLNNCDFEAGLEGWTSQPAGAFNIAATNHVLTDGGPVGPSYVAPDSRSLWTNFFTFMPDLPPLMQRFSFDNSRPIYFSFWASGHAMIKLRADGTQGGLTTRLIDINDNPGVAQWFNPINGDLLYETRSWVKYQVMYNGPRSLLGDYTLLLFNPRDNCHYDPVEVNGILVYSEHCVDSLYDGFSIGDGGFTETCSWSPTATPVGTEYKTLTPSQSPTPSRTPTGTIRPSRTPSRTPVPSVTRTGLPTWTAQPSRTARPTSTQDPTSTLPPTWTGVPGGGGTYTPYPTGTPWPTYTPFPTGTPAPWGTPRAPSDPGPGAICEMPDDWYNVSAWLDFEVCRVLRWASWSPENDDQVDAMSELLMQVEPYGSMMEGYESVVMLQDVWNSYDWISTGYEGANYVSRPSLESITLPALDGSDFSFFPDTVFQARIDEEVEFCKDRTMTVFGARVSEGMCIVWTYYYVTGIVAWIQFGWDLAVLVMLIRYFYRAIFTRG